MLALSTLHTLLAQVLQPPGLHTAALITQSGAIISSATLHPRAKDHVRVIVGLSSEVWQETRDKDQGMVDSELGRILVLPIYDPVEDVQDTTSVSTNKHQPLMLVCLNASDSVAWEELRVKGNEVSAHLVEPLSKFRDILTVARPPPRSSTALR